MNDFTKPFESNVLSHALRAVPMWLDPDGEKTAEYVAAAVFADAHRRYRIAEAKLTLSLDEGEPVDARSTAIESYRDASDALRAAYMDARAMNAVREGITPSFITENDAREIAKALGLLHEQGEREGRISYALEQVGALEELFEGIACNEGGVPADIFVR